MILCERAFNGRFERAMSGPDMDNLIIEVDKFQRQSRAK